MEEIKEGSKEEIPKDVQKRKSKLNNFFFGWIKDNYDKTFLVVLIIAFAIRLYIFSQTLDQPIWWDAADYITGAKVLGKNLDINYEFSRQSSNRLHLILF